jgi:ABC-type transport system involved in multi-copper enzyme maturation permease subunit
MFGTIVRKEILENISGLKFQVVMLFSCLLIIFSVYIGIEGYQKRLEEYNTSVKNHEDMLRNHPSWPMLASLGYNIDKPPSTLSVVAEGLEGVLGRSVRIDAVSPVKLEGSKYSDNPILAIFGSFDLMFVMRVVLGLFAILFSYDAISGEHERGTLKLMLANSVPRDTIILGKAVGLFLCLVIPLTIPLLIGGLMMVLSPSVDMSGDIWGRLLGITLMSLLYLACFFALGILISACTHRASTSFMILLFIWIASAFVIPRASVIIAGRVSPAMSLQELNSRKNANMQEMMDGMSGMKYEEMQSKNEKLEAEYSRQIQRQVSVAKNLSRISPAACMTYVTLSLADTGVTRHERFLAEAKSYKPQFVAVVGRMMSEVDFSTMFTDPKKPDTSQVPRFEFHEEQLGDAVSRARTDFIITGILTVIFFVGAYLAFLRYDASR